MGQRGVFALVERVAAIREFPRAYAGEPGRKRLWSSFAAELNQRVPVRSGTCKAGTSH